LRLLFEPGFGVRGRNAELAKEQMRRWASLPGGRLSLVAESRSMADVYERLCGVPVRVVPLPVRYPVSATETGVNRAPHIVFLGEGRPEKGYHLLPRALRTILARHSAVRVTLQASSRFAVDSEDARSLQALSPSFSVRRGPLSTGAYNDLLLSADIVLVAYDPEPYARRASQIFLEAAGTGKVALATRGTWIQRQIERLGITRVCAEEFTSEGVADALDRLLREWPIAARRSMRAARAIRDSHNPARFVDELLRVTGREGARG
jgi:glycosyltransferase involved in cell wall biosynthesis